MTISLSPKAHLKITVEHPVVTVFTLLYFVIKCLHSRGKEEPDKKLCKNKIFSNMNSYHKEKCFHSQNRE